MLLIGATLTTWLAQDGIDKTTIGLRVWPSSSTISSSCGRGSSTGSAAHPHRPVGQRRAWLFFVTALLVRRRSWMLGFRTRADHLGRLRLLRRSWSPSLGATQDIVIDAYRIELLSRASSASASRAIVAIWLGAFVAGVGTIALALVRRRGSAGRAPICLRRLLRIPAMITRPDRRRAGAARQGARQASDRRASASGSRRRSSGRSANSSCAAARCSSCCSSCSTSSATRSGQLVLRPLLDDLGFTNDEILVIYDVGVGFWGLIVGIFVGGSFYGLARHGRALGAARPGPDERLERELRHPRHGRAIPISGSPRRWPPRISPSGIGGDRRSSPISRR